MRYGGHTSCIDVALADGTRIVLDAGTGLRMLGHALAGPTPLAHRAGIGRTPVPIVLTHRHSDHVIGFASFAAHVASTHDIELSCPGVSVDALRDLVRQQLSEPLFPHIDGVLDAVRVTAFEADGERAYGRLARVRALPAHHPGGASILCVHDAGGLLLAYAPDNELQLDAADDVIIRWRALLIEALRGVPLLLHDATYTDNELPLHRGWGHSSAEEATRFAMSCEARTLLLTHHHPDRSDNDVDALVAKCRELVREAGSSMHVAAAVGTETMDIAQSAVPITTRTARPMPA